MFPAILSRARCCLQVSAGLLFWPKSSNIGSPFNLALLYSPVLLHLQLLDYMSKLPTSNIALTPCSSRSLPPSAIQQLEALGRSATFTTPKLPQSDGVDPEMLLLPLEYPLAHSSSVTFSLGHRVMNLRSHGPVPFGLTGTVVAVHESAADVLFDKWFLAGGNLHGTCTDFRAFHVPLWTLLNLSQQHYVVSPRDAASTKTKKKKGKKASSNPFDALM
eukprot:m.97877 g.97877  ORF g.97877 m.97877 type:complete len:218 (-) comp13113_c1_seq1:4693-5346(-)